MIKIYALLFWALWCATPIYAQMCPGGGLDFNSAVTFDPAWIYGCQTGTSCNGGVNFDNRSGCQPTTAMDACAPAPTCGSVSNRASNIWFKFYASASTVTISTFQNTSFIISIQAFSGGPSCGSLTQIGCVNAGGPSGGANLSLSGLTVGQLYYYRIYGDAGPVSQRSGLYCFCGTTGLNNFILPTCLTYFKGYSRTDQIELNWGISPDMNPLNIDIEYSSDHVNFSRLGSVTSVANKFSYQFKYEPSSLLLTYYRLKITDSKGQVKFSPIINLQPANTFKDILLTSLKGDEYLIRVQKSLQIILYNSSGVFLRTYNLSPGRHQLSFKLLPKGIYFIRVKNTSKVQKLII